MRVLVDEEDLVSRAILKLNLEKWGYEVVVCADEALNEAKASGRNCVLVAGGLNGQADSPCVAPPFLATDSAGIAEEKAALILSLRGEFGLPARGLRPSFVFCLPSHRA